MHDSDAIKTYRYLRIAMAAVVLLLGASVLFERWKVDCWQTSISAYYYTPVRAVFVGGLMAIGMCLIVLKGSTSWEDGFLNTAGMLAPVVAVVPTSGVGACWSIQPEPLPIGSDGNLAPWVVANIDNNIKALVTAGLAGLVATAVIVAIIARREQMSVREVGHTGTRIGLAIAFGILLVGWAAWAFWDGFPENAHNIAAYGMFGFLGLTVGSNARHHRNNPATRTYFYWYTAIAALMALSLVAMLASMRWDYWVLALEIAEITLFATYWLVQTKEHWQETSG